MSELPKWIRKMILRDAEFYSVPIMGIASKCCPKCGGYDLEKLHLMPGECVPVKNAMPRDCENEFASRKNEQLEAIKECLSIYCKTCRYVYQTEPLDHANPNLD